MHTLDVSYATGGEHVSLDGCTGGALPDVVYCPPASALVAILLPSRGTLSAAERAQVIQSRTTGVQTLTAVLAVSYTVGKHRGTFDMIVNYAAPGSVRFTALKDMLLSTQVLFDVLFTGETYRLLVRDDKGEQISQAPVTQFAPTYPTFRTFFLVGRHFFTGFRWPGAASQVQCCRNPTDYQATEWCQGTLVEPGQTRSRLPRRASRGRRRRKLYR